MRRLNTAAVFAALTGVLALLAIDYQGGHAAQDRYATLIQAIDVAYNDIDQLRDQQAQEHIIELPEDGGAWYLSLVYPVKHGIDDPTSRRVETMMASNPRLQSLLAQCHVNRYVPGNPTYETRYRKSWGVPTEQAAIVLQMPDGKLCFKATGPNIPRDANQLADQIATAIADCRPRPKPDPAPTPQPDLTPAIPDTLISPDAPSNEENLAGALIAIGIAALVGAGIAWKKEGGM